MRRPSRVLAIVAPLAAVALATLVLAGPALGQVTAGKKSGELGDDAQCYGHHREEGFRPMDLFPTTVQMVRRGEVFEFEVTLTVPWLHDVLQPYAFVNISGIPGARFPGEHEPLLAAAEGVLSPAALLAVPVPGQGLGPSSETHTFTVDENATEVVATLVGDPGQAGRNVWTVEVVTPTGKRFAPPVRQVRDDVQPGAAPANRAEVRVPYADVSEGGAGEWQAIVRHVRGTDATAPYDLGLQVHYNLSKSQEIIVRGPDRLAKRTQHTFAFQIVAPPESMENGELLYGGHVVAHYLHTDPNADDYGNFTKWNTLSFRVGEQLVVGNADPRMFLGPDPGPVMRAYGQILGYASSFLLLPALFLGGTFGTGSVRLFNRVLGSPRRRVLWHNATSYLLLATALVHMYLFLIEHFWDWSVGVVWGGLSLAAIIGLAFTGALQRRIVAKWGFERWRFMHFSLGTVVVGFVLVHIFADGTHLAALRAWLAGV